MAKSNTINGERLSEAPEQPQAGRTSPMITRSERLASLLIALAILVFLGLSAWALFVLPMPDSYRWYGDETWLMLAWKQLIAHGVMSVPIAHGSTLATSTGFLTGSAWLSGVIYGLPQLLLPSDLDMVKIGRTITFLFSIATVGVLVWTGFKLAVRGVVLLFAILLLVTSESFIYASHSARYDILTGFVVLCFVCFFTLLVKQGKILHPISWCIVGASIGIAAFTISPHLEAFLFPFAVVLALYFRLYKSLFSLVLFAIGGIIAVALVALLYWVSTSSPSLIGPNGFGNQFTSVLVNLPIRHFFSWSAQSHQIGAKLFYLWDEAAPFAVALPLLILSEILLWKRRVITPERKFLLAAMLSIIFSGLFLQSTLPYYLAHILPVLTLLFAVELSEWCSIWTETNSTRIPALVLAGIATVWLCYAIPKLLLARERGTTLVTNNSAAIQAALEEASRSWRHGGSRKIVLGQAPALHELLRDPRLAIMSEAFLFFPASSATPAQVMEQQHVQYAIDYRLPMTQGYQSAIDTLGQPIFSRSGTLLDRRVDYFSTQPLPINTLTLYAFSPDAR